MKLPTNPGELVDGKYRLSDLLGEGETSVVWRVQPVDDFEVYALKMPRSPDVRERFEREAKALARLDHPNCLRVIEVGFSDAGDFPYLVTEIIVGVPLDARADGLLSVPDAIRALTEIASAVDHAHSRWVHHPALALKDIEQDLVGGGVKVRGFDVGAPDDRVLSACKALGTIAIALLEGPGADGVRRTDCPPALAELAQRLLAFDPPCSSVSEVVDALVRPDMSVLLCSACSTPLGDWSAGEVSIVVAGRLFVAHHYHPCSKCGSWTVAHIAEGYHGELEFSSSEPLDAAVGQKCLRLVRSCPAPADPTCRCAAHAQLFSGVPRQLGSRLRCVFVASEVRVDGYDADGIFDLSTFSGICVGRLRSAEISIGADIGGRRTFNLARRDGGWFFVVGNEHALALVDGIETRMGSGPRRLQPGSTVEIRRAYREEVVHRFVFEEFELPAD